MTTRASLPVTKKSTTDRTNKLQLGAVRAWFRVGSAVVPSLAERHATRLFFTPRRLRRVPAHGLQARAFELRVDGNRIRCWSYGSGPTVLLVHGWGGAACDWDALVPMLVAAGYRAVVFDLPAHGSSGGRQTTLPRIVRVLHVLVAELSAPPESWTEPLRAVVAHSFGAAAVAMALREGLEVGAAVLVAPVARPMSFLDPFADRIGLAPARRAGMRERIRDLVGGDLSRIDVVEAARRLSLPALIVHDRQDRTVPWQQGESIARAWAGAELVSPDGLGHTGLLRSEETLRLVLRFLQGATAPGASRPAT